jgi:hypothetical protein
MTKYSLLLCLFALVACTSPIPYEIVVALHNACDYPVQVVSPPGDWSGYGLNKRLKSDETANVSFWEYDASDNVLVYLYVWELPNNNRLVISADGNQIKLTTAQFLEELKRAKYAKVGVTHTFLIDNPSLCPSANLQKIKTVE